MASRPRYWVEQGACIVGRWSQNVCVCVCVCVCVNEGGAAEWSD